MATVNAQHASSQHHSFLGDRTHTYCAFDPLSDMIAGREVSEGPAVMHADGDRSPHHAELADTVRHNLLSPHPTREDIYPKALLGAHFISPEG